MEMPEQLLDGKFFFLDHLLFVESLRDIQILYTTVRSLIAGSNLLNKCLHNNSTYPDNDTLWLFYSNFHLLCGKRKSRVIHGIFLPIHS